MWFWIADRKHFCLTILLFLIEPWLSIISSVLANFIQILGRWHVFGSFNSVGLYNVFNFDFVVQLWGVGHIAGYCSSKGLFYLPPKMMLLLCGIRFPNEWTNLFHFSIFSELENFTVSFIFFVLTMEKQRLFW